MPIISACHSFLSLHASGKWFESFRFKTDADDYLHPVGRDMVLLRVELPPTRAFYWLYDIHDVDAFNRFVGSNLRGEVHEIIVGNQCRLFYDIDLKLDACDRDDFVEYYDCPDLNVIGGKLAHVYKHATLISLEEHGIDVDDDLLGFDWMHTMRNRPCGADHKISLHIITNLFVPLAVCGAIACDVKCNVLHENTEVLDISSSMADTLSDAIDDLQYRVRGSLGLPFGTKRVDGGIYTNGIARQYHIPGQHYLITIPDQFSIRDLDVSAYPVSKPRQYGMEASPEFIKAALAHVGNIADYNPRVWDVASSVVKRSTMYVKRRIPSLCSFCNRTHDNDNTMFLIFNADSGVASWKCTRAIRARPIVFYRQEIAIDIDAFARRKLTTRLADVEDDTPGMKSRAPWARPSFICSGSKKRAVQPSVAQCAVQPSVAQCAVQPSVAQCAVQPSVADYDSDGDSRGGYDD